MDENIKKRIEEKMQAIPEKYRSIIQNFGWEKIIEKIGKENNLLYTEIDDLYIETFLIMLGLTKPEDFIYALEDNLSIEREKAEKITNEVNQRLLEPLRDALAKKFPELEAEEDSIEDENTIKNSLENPPSSKPISFVEQKISTPHSIGANSAPIPMPPGEKYSDPYREDF